MGLGQGKPVVSCLEQGARGPLAGEIALSLRSRVASLGRLGPPRRHLAMVTHLGPGRDASLVLSVEPGLGKLSTKAGHLGPQRCQLPLGVGPARLAAGGRRGRRKGQGGAGCHAALAPASKAGAASATS